MTKFKDLPIGSKFDFDHTDIPLLSSIARGPWVKTSARSYEHVEALRFGIIKIGSVNTEVIKQED